MKRLHIITKPTRVEELEQFDTDDIESTWQLRAERLLARRSRKFKQAL